MAYILELHTANGWSIDPTYLGPAATYADTTFTTKQAGLEFIADLELSPADARLSETPGPAVLEVLEQRSIGCDFYSWHVSGGVLDLRRATLLDALIAAYDPCMRDWTQFVEQELS